MSPIAIVMTMTLAVLLAGALWPGADSRAAIYVSAALVATMLVLTLVGVGR